MTEPSFPQALLSDLGRDVYAPCMALRIGENPAAPDLVASLTDVVVSRERGVPGSFSLTLNDVDLKWVAPDGPLARGSQVSIDLGYDGRPETVFTGFIRQVSADFPQSGPAAVRVDGYDALHDLTQQFHHKVYAGERTDEGLADSDVFTAVASRTDQRSTAPSSERRQRPRVQVNESDFQFLQMLGAAADRDLFVDPRGVLRFAPQTDDSQPAVRLTRGRNLLSFGARRSDVGQVDKVEVRSWDPAQKSVVVGSASTDGTAGRDHPRTLVVDTADVDSGTGATRMAATLLEQRRRAGQSAHGSTIGNPSLTIGRRVEISGVGQFDGTYVITGVSHQFGSAGFISSFQAEAVPSTAGVRSRALGSAGEYSPNPARSISGVVPGVVMEDDEGTKQARLRVRLPVLGDDVMVWARVAVPVAGRDTGTLWLPRAGDEVLVAFELGDPARPYVVGSLWSDQDPSPEVEANVREVLLLRTASGHRFELVDADGERKISLVDSDGNGVLIDSEAGTVTIRAAKGISLNTPDGALTIDARDAAVRTTGDLTAESDGNQTFKAGATSTVKASTVRIN
jgi:uncharacterized protein involved in type VI secretion and phage assembly